MATLISTLDDEATANRSNLSNETKARSSLSPMAVTSIANLIALPEFDEVIFASPEIEASTGDDFGVPSPLSMSFNPITENNVGETDGNATAQRVWLCSPPPRSSTLPEDLDLSGPPDSLDISHAVPIQMTRSKSEAAVTDVLHTQHLPHMPRMQPSSYGTRCGKTMRLNRPFVVRSVSTSRLATEFDEQGRVICLSEHSGRVLGNKVSTDLTMWKIKPAVVHGMPQTPTSPASGSLRGSLDGRSTFARAARSGQGKGTSSEFTAYADAEKSKFRFKV